MSSLFFFQLCAGERKSVEELLFFGGLQLFRGLFDDAYWCGMQTDRRDPSRLPDSGGRKQAKKLIHCGLLDTHSQTGQGLNLQFPLSWILERSTVAKPFLRFLMIGF